MNKHKNAIIFSDILIILGLMIATKILASILIPYINEAYSLRTNIDSSVDIFSYLSGGRSWFSTSLQGYELPEHKWYIVLAIAVMVQTITGEMESLLGYSTLSTGDGGKNFIRDKIVSFLIVSPVTTAFMLQLTIFFVLTVCPQNIPLVFVLGELIVFCLPALIHRFVIRREFSLTGLIFGIIKIFVLYNIAKTESKILVFILYALVFAKDLIDSFIAEREGVSDRFFFPGFISFLLYGAWIAAGIMIIRPVVSTHMPTIEETVEEVFCSNIATGDNAVRYIRTDGCAITSDNTVLLENTRQIAVCKTNSFYLGNDSILWALNGSGDLPAKVMEHVAYISAFRDTLIIIDDNGDLYGFGDFYNYLPDRPCFDEVTLIESGYQLAKGDVGEEHILLIDESGNLYSMGGNSVGELGIESTSRELQGIQAVMSGVKEVAAGLGTSYALTEEGKIFAWGRNEVGQLGCGIHVPDFKLGHGYAVNDDMTHADVPQELTIDAVVTEIAVGVQAAFALDENGNVWAWGHGVTKESLALPVIIGHDIRHIASCKYTSGVSSQYLYMIDSTDTAVRKTFSSNTTFDVSNVEIVIDTSNWMPEPIQEVSSTLENYLDKYFPSEDEDVEEIPEQPVQAVLEFANSERSEAFGYREFEGHTYRVFGEYMYMKTAETYCESMGGHLVTITSQEEMDFVIRMMQESKENGAGSSNFNIGLTNKDGYAWVTGEDTSFVNAVHANQAYTSDDGEGVIRTTGGMNVGMMDRRPFICEWDD